MSTDNISDLIAELRALHAASTPGEWAKNGTDVCSFSAIVGNCICDAPPAYCEKSIEYWPANAAITAAALLAVGACKEEEIDG